MANMGKIHNPKNITVKCNRLVVREPSEQVRPFACVRGLSRSDDRVNEIRARLQAGSYRIEYEKLADRLLGIWGAGGGPAS